MTNSRYNNVLFIVFSVLISLFLAFGCEKKAPPEPVEQPVEQKNVTELEGVWFGSEVDGRPGNWIFIISQNRVNVAGPDDESYEGTFSLNRQANPKQMDFVIEQSSNKDYIGKTSLGIYKLEADKLTLAANEPGATIRPVLFERKNARLWVLNKQ